MGSEGYNGWSNYETWCVALWIDNDEGAQTMAHEMALEAIEDWEGDEDAARFELAEKLEASFGPDSEVWGAPVVAGPAADLLGKAWGNVEWREVAGHYMADAMETWKADNATEETEGA